MFTLRVTTATALAVTLGAAPTTGWAAANDVTIRLIHVPDGKPVSGAVIIESKTDMGPSGMAQMPGKVTPPKTGESGAYRFQTENGMAGKWALTLAAKV